MSTKVKAPTHLGVGGKALWSDVTSKYTLRQDELRCLEDACGATDMLDALMKAWVELGRPFMSTGSMGQEVEHPLIGSIDKQRKTRQTFLAKLKLPDDASGDAGAEPNQQRGAAQSRWGAAHGKGA